MFGSKASRPGSAAHASRRLEIENLESRQMMATTRLVLDFTPDTRSGSFADTFRYSQYTDGTYPNWLDFNGDRAISDADVRIAANHVHNGVEHYFAAAARNYSVGVFHSDVMQNTNFGARYLQWGQRYSDQQVLVMYFGGRNEGELGRAPLARDGYNVEGYGQTYTQETAHMLMRRSGVTKEMFVWSVAHTASHELGHMLGLRHSRNLYNNDLMNPSQSLRPWNEVFSGVSQRTSDGTVQNAVSELRRSFAGQRTYFQGVDGGHYQLADDHEDCNHGLELPGDDHAAPLGGGLLSIETVAALLAHIHTTETSDTFTDLEASVATVAASHSQRVVSLPVNNVLRTNHLTVGPVATSHAATSADDLFAEWDSLGGDPLGGDPLVD